MSSVNDLKKELRTKGQKGINGRPVTLLLTVCERTFEYYNGIRVRFSPTDNRHFENVAMYCRIDASRIGVPAETVTENAVFFEDYLLRLLAPHISKLEKMYVNENKVDHLNGKIACQMTDQTVCRRSGMLYDRERDTFIMKIFVTFPTGGGHTILGERTVRMITDILKLIDEKLDTIDKDELSAGLQCFRKQQMIRRYCEDNGLAAFIGDGSILPRRGDTELPLEGAVPFSSPETLRVPVPLGNGEVIHGMGIPRGVTVITGAGFSGKTTLLEALEAGIYDHIPGDGREYVITDKSALMTNSEDGRYVGNADLSPFFTRIPGHDVHDFTTRHASGSVSQAVNITGAVSAGVRLLLIDEDKSATNFMMRDGKMRRIIKNEIIIPFTDRVRELSCEAGVSSVLVIGGSGEYLSCADLVILMEDFVPRDITCEVKAAESLYSKIPAADWNIHRYLLPPVTERQFMYFGVVKTENEQKIILDDNSADITQLTAVTSAEQMNTLAYISERLLREGSGDCEITVRAEELLHEMFDGEDFRVDSMSRGVEARFYSEIRPIDAFACVDRMRGARFANKTIEIGTHSRITTAT